MDREYDQGGLGFPRFFGVILLAMTVVGTVDLILDDPEIWLSVHVFVDVGFILLCLGAAAYLWRGWYGAQRTLSQTREALAEHKVERDAWRQRTQKLLKGLGEAIDVQLHNWGLTAAERATALMLLKGYSHREIAELHDRSERTVRHHSVAVYRKSGLSGRAELSAFFLEDLLLPLAEGEGEGGS